MLESFLKHLYRLHLLLRQLRLAQRRELLNCTLPKELAQPLAPLGFALACIGPWRGCPPRQMEAVASGIQCVLSKDYDGLVDAFTRTGFIGSPLEWRAKEEGIDLNTICPRGKGRACDPKAAAAASSPASRGKAITAN